MSAETTRLVRTRQKIHLRGCRHDVNTVPWLWAEGRDDDEWLCKTWLVPCRVCLPEQFQRQADAKARAAGDGGNT